MRLFSRALAVVVIAALFAEGLLQLASAFSVGRSIGELDGREVVLCVGDSHTYGVMVEEAEAYPARLDRFLDEQVPGRFAVVNLREISSRCGASSGSMKCSTEGRRPRKENSPPKSMATS